jgi:hypothetical protein
MIIKLFFFPNIIKINDIKKQTTYRYQLLSYPLPSNGSSLRDLKCTHSDYQASDESGIVIFRHYL